MESFKVYPITPMGAPRMTRADAWRLPVRDCVSRYWAFKDEVRLRGVTLPERPKIVFLIKMPDSWSKKKKALMDGKPHKQKYDLDNLLKALFDAIYEDDAHIWCVSAEKLWSYEGGIKIGNMQD